MNRVELINSWTPMTKGNIDFETSLIGQPEVAKMLNFYVASNNGETPFPTMLFSGSQGLGKTYTSHMVASALGRKMIEVNCGGLKIRKDLYDDILLGRVMGSDRVTILFDEAHKMPSAITNEILTLTNPNDEFSNEINYKGVDLVFDMSKINIIFATTDANRISRPLVNRCEEIYFSLYGSEDLFKILHMYLGDYSINVDGQVRIDIGYACRGRARSAFLLAQNIRRICYINKTTVLTHKEWRELSTIMGIHKLGLNDKELKLIELLNEHDFLSCSNLATKFGVTEENIKDEWEQRPKELGLVQSTSKGRSLTASGEVYLQEHLNKLKIVA